MANKILTDRVSVRVTAKQADLSSQNKGTGRNIEKALGGSGLTDAQAEAIGAACGDTIADEDGNLWINEDDIVAAGKAMYANGAFPTKTIYKYAGVSALSVSDFPLVDLGSVTYGNVNHNYAYGPLVTCNGASIYLAGSSAYNNSQQNSVIKRYTNVRVALVAEHSTSGDVTSPINGYRLINTTPATGSLDARYIHVHSNGDSYYSNSNNPYIPISGPNFDDPTLEQRQNITSDLPLNDVAFAYSNLNYYSSTPTEETTGGSLIDWTKSDEEIKRDIKELHESWDVSEHPGASGQGVGAGTYILAGPIEFNDADPVG